MLTRHTLPLKSAGAAQNGSGEPSQLSLSRKHVFVFVKMHRKEFKTIWHVEGHKAAEAHCSIGAVDVLGSARCMQQQALVSHAGRHSMQFAIGLLSRTTQDLHLASLKLQGRVRYRRLNMY